MFPSTMHKDSFVLLNLLSVVVLIITILTSVKQYLNVVFIYISLISDDKTL